MSSKYGKTEANEVLETFAELYMDSKDLEGYTLDDLDLPDYIRTFRGWEHKSDEFWDYKADVTEQIDELADLDE